MKHLHNIALRCGAATLAVRVALGLKLLLNPLIITDQSRFLLLEGALITALADIGKATAMASRWWCTT
jgi:hypothetical protein